MLGLPRAEHGARAAAVVDGYTEEFQSTFLALLKQAHGQTRVSAKVHGQCSSLLWPVLRQAYWDVQAGLKSRLGAQAPEILLAMQVVYNEYINDRHHIHMNSTNFLTLTDFVKHLGREGICRVDETPKGWFISLIMKDPMEHLSDERRIKRAKHEKVRARSRPPACGLRLPWCAPPVP